jgi:putative intracellular protease/amidase
VSAAALLALTSVRTIPGTNRHTGAYASEVAETWDVFASAGFAVDVVSVCGGPVPLEAVNRASPVQSALLDDPRMADLLASSPRPAAVRAADYQIVLLVGGHGAVWDLPSDAELATLVGQVHAAGGVVASVCHGAAGLLEVTGPAGRRLIEGRRIAAFTNDEERAVGMVSVVPFLLADELTARGAVHEAAPSFLPHVVVDGNLVTGQNPASAAGVARSAVQAAYRSFGVARL